VAVVMVVLADVNLPGSGNGTAMNGSTAGVSADGGCGGGRTVNGSSEPEGEPEGCGGPAAA